MTRTFLLLLCVPAILLAQEPAVKSDPRTVVKFILGLQDKETGGFKVDAAASKPSLRATSGAVRALAKLGEKVPNQQKVEKFVLDCLDKESGGFAEPDGKPDVTITSIGIMAACELGIEKAKFKSAMMYLAKNAKTFEEVRIGAAAVESWGVKECPFKLDEWEKIAIKFGQRELPSRDPKNGLARDEASVIAFALRLKLDVKKMSSHPFLDMVAPLTLGQRDDGAWGKFNEKASDIETTYRVMRAFYLLNNQPTDLTKVRDFIQKHANEDGGYGMKPGEKSSMSGVYYAVFINAWLDAMKKK